MNFLRNKPALGAFLAFLGGLLIIGPLDGFHSHTGVQLYLIDDFNVTDTNWPWYIPLQMGLAGLVLFSSWRWQLPLWQKLLPNEPLRRGLPPIGIMVGATFFIFLGFGLSWFLHGSDFRLGYYLLIFWASLLFLTVSGSRFQVIAFLLTALAGVAFESFLLDPTIGYYRFAQADFFGRSPGWLTFVYGWVGLFIHELVVGSLPGSQTNIRVLA